MSSQKRLWLFSLPILICLFPVFGYGGERGKVDLLKKPFLIIDGYIIQASSNGDELVYPPAPEISVSVLEQTAKGVDGYYQKLKALYSFSSFQLVRSFRFVYQIKDPLRPNTRTPRTTHFTVGNGGKEDSFVVKILPLRIEESGMIQLQLEVTKDGQPYLGTDISVKGEKPVLVGRMMEKEGNKASFFAFTPSLSATKVKETVGASYTPPEVIKFVKPEYPPGALRDKVSGMVILKLFVDTTGNVTKTEVIQSLREDCDKAAIEAARKCKFKPALSDGKPVRVWISYPVKFTVVPR